MGTSPISAMLKDSNGAAPLKEYSQFMSHTMCGLWYQRVRTHDGMDHTMHKTASRLIQDSLAEPANK